MPELKDIVRAVFQHIHMIVWAMDNDGVVLLAEGSPLFSIGYEAGQMVGHNLFQAFGGDPATVEQLQRALKGESFTSVGAAGGRTLATRYAPFHDPQGVQIGVVGITTDETEHLAAREELATRTAALSEQAELLDLAHDAIMVCRIDGTITY